MNMNILLKIIQEEIDKACLDLENRMFFEQAPPADPAAPPADPAAGGPADPAAGGGEAPAGGGEEEKEEDEVSKTIETLAKRNATDIKKTIISDVQSGERDKAEEVIATVDAEKEEAPKSMKDAVKSIKRVFKFKVPDDVKAAAEKKVKEKNDKEKKEKEEKAKASAGEAAPAAPGGAPATPPAAPVTESKLQNTLREYLFYKKLYEKENRGSK